MKVRALAALALGAATPAMTGPPYLTDDPSPTDTGQWEIYGSARARAIRSSTVR